MRKIILLFFVALLIIGGYYLLSKQAKAKDNHFGVGVFQYYSEKGLSSDAWKNHLDWAKNMVGDGGYVKLFFPWIGNPDAPVGTYKQVLQETYARGLTPIVRLDGSWVTVPGKNAGLNGCWERPPQDIGTAYSESAGKYTQYAQKVAEFVDSLPTPPQGKTLYVELWNEMNYDNIEWCDERGNSRSEPENYARFYIEVYNRINSLGKPYIKLTNGGLGRAGASEYLRSMLSAMYTTVGQNPSTLQSLLEYYSIHIYPPNNSEQAFINGMSSYDDQLKIFANFGIDPNSLKVLMTEGGYIRGSDTPQNEDTKQAKLNVELAKKLSSDPRIVAMNFFSLDDYTDKTISSEQSPLDTTLFVPTNSGTSSGLPSGARPVYSALKDYMTGSSGGRSSQETKAIAPVGYAIAENQATIDSISTPLVYAPTYPIDVPYTLVDKSPGPKVLFVKFFYSNSGTRVEQVTLTYNPVQVNKVCNPGQTVTMCKQTQCALNQEVENPNNVLGVQAGSCGNLTYYSCSDIKCPDGSIAPGGGCYPDNYTSDCLNNCKEATAGRPLSAPTASTPTPQPVVNSSQCPDECYADELRVSVGKNSAGLCDSGTSSSVYPCRAGAVGQQRVCKGQNYVCVDGASSGFYWSQIGNLVPTPTPTAIPATPTPKTSPSPTNMGYATVFTCNSVGTAWVCSSTSLSESCKK